MAWRLEWARGSRQGEGYKPTQSKQGENRCESVWLYVVRGDRRKSARGERGGAVGHGCVGRDERRRARTVFGGLVGPLGLPRQASVRPRWV